VLEFGLHDPSGKGWDIGGDLYSTNPRFIAGAFMTEMMAAWRAYRGDSGQRILPDDGGMMQQASIMIEAFYFMDKVFRELTHADEN